MLSKIQCHDHLINLSLLLCAQAVSLNFSWATADNFHRHERRKLKPHTKLLWSSSTTACQGSASQGVGEQLGSPSGHTGALIPNSNSAADPSDIPLPRLFSEDKGILTLYTLHQHLSWDQRLYTLPPMQMWKALEAPPRDGIRVGAGPGPGWFRGEWPERSRAVLPSPARALPAGNSTARGVSHPASARAASLKKTGQKLLSTGHSCVC